MTTSMMEDIASKVPTTLGELAMCGISRNVVQDYGERIIKNIKSFIVQENLQKFIQYRVGSNNNAMIDLSHDSDEFDDGIDYSSIKMPAAKHTTKNDIV